MLHRICVCVCNVCQCARGCYVCGRKSLLLTSLLLCCHPAVQLDSWSVGALAYDVLCGRPPFAAHEDIPREDERRAILQEVRSARIL